MELSKAQKTDWSISESIMQAMLFFSSSVAKIFFTLKAVLSKCGCCEEPGKARASSLKVFGVIKLFRFSCIEGIKKSGLKVILCNGARGLRHITHLNISAWQKLVAEREI